MPDADILIHAGDWTYTKNKEHANDFNEWLGSLPHKHKIVVNGNHEFKAEWDAKEILYNATYLRDETISIQVEGKKGELKVHGTDFFHNRIYGVNPAFDAIPSDVDVLIVHNPPLGYCDELEIGGHAGDPAMREELDTR